MECGIFASRKYFCCMALPMEGSREDISFMSGLFLAGNT